MTRLLRWLREALYPWKCPHEWAPYCNVPEWHLTIQGGRIVDCKTVIRRQSIWICTRCGDTTRFNERIESAFMEGVPDDSAAEHE